jgi:hypothetical protein
VASKKRTDVSATTWWKANFDTERKKTLLNRLFTDKNTELQRTTAHYSKNCWILRLYSLFLSILTWMVQNPMVNFRVILCRFIKITEKKLTWTISRSLTNEHGFIVHCHWCLQKRDERKYCLIVRKIFLLIRFIMYNNNCLNKKNVTSEPHGVLISINEPTNIGEDLEKFYWKSGLAFQEKAWTNPRGVQHELRNVEAGALRLYHYWFDADSDALYGLIRLWCTIHGSRKGLNNTGGTVNQYYAYEYVVRPYQNGEKRKLINWLSTP